MTVHAPELLTPEEFASLMEALVPVHEHVRDLHGEPIPTGAALGLGHADLAKH